MGAYKYAKLARVFGTAREIGVMLGVTFLALVVGGLFLGASLLVTGASEPPLVASVLASSGGFGVVAGSYLYVTGRGAEYVDVSVPTGRTLALGVGTGIGVFALQGAIDGLGRLAGLSMGLDQVAQQAAADPVTLVLVIAVNLALVGPMEELFFRNVLQKRLAERFSGYTAIVLVSLLFAPLHLSNFGGDSPIASAVSLTGVFLASIAYGFAFEKWNRLEIVAIAHGVQNSIVFAVVYLLA